MDYRIGKLACKRSGKTFYSGEHHNTVKAIVINPHTGNEAYSFIEDDSIVDTRSCLIERPKQSRNRKKKNREERAKQKLVAIETRHKKDIQGIKFLISIDVEKFERQQHKITEIGYTIITVDGTHVETKHLIIKEHYNKRNKKFVCDNKDNFDFGDSYHVSLKTAFVMLTHACKKVDGVVGHTVKGDLRDLQKAGMCMDGIMSLPRFDISHMYRLLTKNLQVTGLVKMSELMGQEIEHPHNAGNDAYYSADLFVKIHRQIS